MKTILRWLICFLSLLIVNTIFPNSLVNNGGIPTLLAAGTILWLVNLFIKPVAQVIAIPFTILTLGAFYFIVNTLLVGLALVLVPALSGNFLSWILISILISGLNLVLTSK